MSSQSIQSPKQDASANAAQAARLARMARQQVYNEKAAKFYGIAMACVIVLFTISHWSRFLYGRYSAREATTSSLMKCQIRLTRYGFTSYWTTVLIFAVFLDVSWFAEYLASPHLVMEHWWHYIWVSTLH